MSSDSETAVRERCDVREVENLWIPLADGTRLAARLWLPIASEVAPVPAIVEWIPYRKRDGTRQRDEGLHRAFAQGGYAALRIDLRGSGDSDGVLLDEYLPQEQADAVEALSWIASRPWCSGRIGMIGKSWGGFSALQIAAHAPPELAAVISVCSTDDRYADDAHYMGGCLLNENLLWGSVLLTLAAMPPDPEVVGEGWRRTWLSRLESVPLFAELWMRHPLRDAYWKQGSVCEDFGSIACPVWVVGGWADGYTNAVPRLLEGLRVPRRGLIGPWAHHYPHEGQPGPAIDFVAESLRWWDRWLLERKNGVERLPMLRAWMQESVAPSFGREHRPGRWVAEEVWPSEKIEHERYHFGSGSWTRGGDSLGAAGAAPLVHQSAQDVGLAAGSWCSFGLAGDQPGDQRSDDEGSMCLDSEPLDQRLELLGSPRLHLELSVDRPFGWIAARLVDVAPDGTATRVSYGLLNLAHAPGHEQATAPRPGERFAVDLELGDLAHAFPAGHRLRLAISTTYWPIAWPSPEPVTLSLHPGNSWIDLPVRPPRAADVRLRELLPPLASEPGEASTARRLLERDPTLGTSCLTVTTDLDAEGKPLHEHIESIGLLVGWGSSEVYRIQRDDPLSAELEVRHQAFLERGSWRVDLRTRSRLRAGAEAFFLDAELIAEEGGEAVMRREWSETIPRTFR
jgi:putative CocE/NonD family hydrolase